MADAVDAIPELTASATAAHSGWYRAAVSGVAWTILGYGAMQLLRFAANLLLTRLLAPELFGVMALVHLFVQGLHMFSDIGLRQAIVQSARGEEPAFLQTAWTLQIGRGLLLWLIAGAIAWPLALSYREPALTWLLPLVGSTALLDGLHSTALILLPRRLMLGRLWLLELVSYAVGLAVLLLWLSALGPGHQSDPVLRHRRLLALGTSAVVSSLMSLVLSYRLLPGLRHRLRWEPTALRDLFAFGGWVTLSTACAFLAGQADRLTLGLLSLKLLGVYHLAVQLTRIPTLLIHDLADKLVFPLTSRLRGTDAAGEPNNTIAHVHLLLLGLAGLMAAGLYAAGPTLIHLVYDQRYAEAGDFVRWLSAAAWLLMLQYARAAFLLAAGNSRQFALGLALKLAAVLPLVLGGYYFFGVTGFLVGLIVVEGLRYLQLVWAAGRAGRGLLAQDMALTVLTVATAMAADRGGACLEGFVPGGAVFAGQVVGLTAGWAVLFGLAWWRGLVHLDGLKRDLN